MNEDTKNTSKQRFSLREAGFTPRVVILSVLFCVFNTIVFGALLIGSNSNGYIPSLSLIFLEAIFVRLFGSKFQLTVQEWSVLLTFEMSGLLSAVSYNAQSDLWHVGTYRGFYRGFLRYFGTIFESFHSQGAPVTSNLFIQTNDAINGYLYGGAIDWAGWMPIILYFIISMASMYIAMHFLSIVFRKSWIDEEELPYPHQMPLYEFINRAKEHDRPSLWNLKLLENKMIWIFFLLGVIYQTLNAMNWWWGTSFQLSYFVDLTPYLYQSFPSNILQFTIVPDMIAGAFLMPLDVLGTGAFSWIFFEGIINWVNVMSGSVPRMDYGSNSWVNGTDMGLIKYDLLFTGWHGVGYGPIYLAIPLILIWKAKGNIINSLHKAISGDSAEPGEAHSWRTVWLGFIACTIIWYVSVIMVGAPPILIISYIGLIGTFLWSSRYIAEAGGAAVYTDQMEFDSNLFMYLEPLRATGSLGFNQSSVTSTLILHQYTGWAAAQQPMIPSLTMFKIGKTTNTNPKVISIAIIIATILGIVIAVPLTIWTQYHYGATYLYARLLQHEGVVTQLSGWPSAWPYLQAQPASYADFTAIPDYYYWFAGGTILIFVLEFLHTRFSWFFFNPIGLIFGVGGPATWFYGWVMVVGFILKWLILRISGSDGYNKVGVPAASGFLLGTGFTIVWWSVLSLVRTL